MSLAVRLKHAFRDFALDLAFEAPPGITVLFGPSGSGKTTVIKAVAGLLRPDEARIARTGHVLFDSDAGIDVPPHRRAAGLIFQEGRLFPHLSVRQNMLYGRLFSTRKTSESELDHMLDMLGIAHLQDRRPAKLSGGEKQRVAIGRALLSSPAIILADEPLASLDAARKAEILPYFERLRDEAAIPVLYVTHDPIEAERLATQIVTLEG